MLATVLAHLRAVLTPGMTTKDLAEEAKKTLRPLGGQPTFLGYYDFPDVLCVSVNDEVVHGIPSTDRIIKDGDIVSMDFGVTYKGLITDAAITRIAGKPASPRAVSLVEATEQSLLAGIAAAHGGVQVGSIAASIQAVLERGGFGIVRDLVGHGVGHELHEDPNIPNYGREGSGPSLEPGMTIAIEPMATLGGHRVFIDDDEWTVLTADGTRAAHFEHTVLLTPESAEILTTL